jgi:Flp pilus assembly pilin Flp
MLADRRGADLVEWIVGIVIVLGVVGVSVYALFQTLGNKFTEMNATIAAGP